MSTQQPPQGYDGAENGYESVTVERNSRGYNYKVRVVKQEGQSDTDWLRRLDTLESMLAYKYGRGDA